VDDAAYAGAATACQGVGLGRVWDAPRAGAGQEVSNFGEEMSEPKPGRAASLDARPGHPCSHVPWLP